MVNEYSRDSKRKMLLGLEKAVGNELKTLQNAVRNNCSPEDTTENNHDGKRIFWVIFVILIVAVFLFWDRGSKVVGLDYVGPLKSKDYSYQYVVELPNPGFRYKCQNEDILSEITADSYIALYVDTFQILAAKNIDSSRPFASLVKLLSAFVVIDEYGLDQEVALLEGVDSQGSSLDLEIGELLTVQDLLGASLVGSKNDAMYVLVQNYPGGSEAFIDALNQKTIYLGLKNTSVVNPVGYDDEEQLSTTRDVTVLAAQAMRNNTISYLVSQPFYNVNSLSRDETIWATNSLLNEISGVIGVKTGFTEDAGQCLAIYVDGDSDFITVVMGSEDRMEDSRKLINWVNEYCSKS